MIDGTVARKTGTVSEFGSKLDTIADIVFVTVCLLKLLPVLDIPAWLYIWIAIIAFIKLVNIVEGCISQKEFVAVHSVINKVAGCLLFIFPMTLTYFDLKYSASVICAVATIAAVYEGYLMSKDAELLRGAWISFKEANPIRTGADLKKETKEPGRDELLPASVSEPQI